MSKSKIRVAEDLTPSERTPPGLQLGNFSLCPHISETERDRERETERERRERERAGRGSCSGVFLFLQGCLFHDEHPTFMTSFKPNPLPKAFSPNTTTFWLGLWHVHLAVGVGGVEHKHTVRSIMRTNDKNLSDFWPERINFCCLKPLSFGSLFICYSRPRKLIDQEVFLERKFKKVTEFWLSPQKSRCEQVL